MEPTVIRWKCNCQLQRKESFYKRREVRAFDQVDKVGLLSDQGREIARRLYDNSYDSEIAIKRIATWFLCMNSECNNSFKRFQSNLLI